MFSAKNYIAAQSPEEAWTLNKKRRNKILGGMLWLKMENITLDTVIDISRLGLDTIEETENEFIIGACVTLGALEAHAGFTSYTQGAFRDAVCHIVGVQFRNLATVGGSVFGRYGFSDVLTVLLCMDTYVELYEGGTVALADFARRKPDNDLLMRIIVKKEEARFMYQSVRNSATDFPVLACASSARGNMIRTAVGARPARAALAADTAMDKTDARKYAGFIRESFSFGSNMRASAEYRRHLAGVLAERAFVKLGGDAV